MGGLPLRSERGGAVARAVASSQPYRDFPSLPVQCVTCARWLDRDRVVVMTVGDEELCGLCLALSTVQSTVTMTQISARDEEEVIGILLSVVSFLRRPRQMS